MINKIQGICDIIRDIKVLFNFDTIGNHLERTVIHKYNDNVKGEMYNFDVVPEVTN
jgi:hypothetical protein